jgi:succinate--hydroxymethylglutarate CoA-transferase
MTLGDMGADVIKVESHSGDDTRSWGPPFLKSKDGKSQESAYYLGVNRNKRSIAIDFKSSSGRELILDLARISDVFIENYIPGKLNSLGLGYENLKAVNPKIIYTSITGYGPTGPSSQKPGYDVVIEAEAGLMHITGTKQTPAKVGVAITDLTTGLYAKGAILAALFSRKNTGKGQKIDVSLLECQVASLANIGSSYLIGGVEAERWGTEHSSIVPYQAFETSDYPIIVGVGNKRQWGKFCGAIGRNDLEKDVKVCAG